MPSRSVRTNPIRLGAILLAAGASSRMGRPKLLLPWGPGSVLRHLLAQWQDLGAEQIAVVCARQNAAVLTELERLAWPRAYAVVNAIPERGMFSSIQSAAQWAGWKPGLTHWAIVLGDQPHVASSTLRTVLDHVRQHGNRICQPSHRGRPRHPVILPRALFESLATARHASLREFLAGAPGGVALCEIDDSALDLDLDTPADYERAIATYLAAGQSLR